MTRKPLKRSTKPMKRTQMKRTQMKRSATRMKRSSTTNSKPGKNPELYAAYLRANPRCELLPLMKDCDTLAWLKLKEAWAGTCGGRLDFLPVERHHIWHRGSRPDLWGNLISLSKLCHDGLCHSHPKEGRIMVMYAKFVKRPLTAHVNGLPYLEWNLDDMRHGAGQDPLGWLECNKSNWPWVEAKRQEMLAELKG